MALEAPCIRLHGSQIYCVIQEDKGLGYYYTCIKLFTHYEMLTVLGVCMVVVTTPTVRGRLFACNLSLGARVLCLSCPELGGCPL